MKFELKYRRALFGLVGAAVVGSIMLAPMVNAQENSDVTQEITGGVLTATIADAQMDDVAYSQIEGLTEGNLTLSIDDLRGTSEGWAVTVESGDFVYGGLSTIGLDLPATGFSITAPGIPADISGQPTGLGGPLFVDGGSLDTARTTITAGDGFGSGSYTQELPVELVIPAFSQTGLYTATLIVTTVAAP
ncbi:hypothetical protein BH09CHL1_BH09CHL1_06560 [soil metagenome]